MRAAVRLLGIAAVMLPGALAAGGDLGVPRDGFDRVLLDDGRVVDARALPREGEVVPLEFAAGTIRVPRDRVVEVRPWKDFDPAPRNDAEREKADRGFVRWNGVLVPPERAAALREEEVAKGREAGGGGGRHERVGSLRSVDAGPFRVRCNGVPAERKEWVGLLADYGRLVIPLLPKKSYAPTFEVELDVDEPGPDPARVRPLPRPGEPFDYPAVAPGPARLGLEGAAEDRALPALLDLLAPRIVAEYMPYRFDTVGGWVRHGLARYLALAERKEGRFTLGAVDDASLLLHREMEARDGLPDLETLLRAGNRYYEEDRERREAGAARALVPREDPFDTRLTPAAWMLVHYLMEGDDGKHRKDFLGWLRYAGDHRNDRSWEMRETFEASRDFLLRQLRMKDLDTLAEGVRRHAAGLEYRGAPAWILVAAEALGKGKDPAAARSALEKAVAADPLNGDARAALAGLLPEAEAATQRALARALGAAAPDPPPK